VGGELPDPLSRIVADADRMGSSLGTFAQTIYEDAIDRGLGLFLVDNVPNDGVPLTDADRLDIRPFFRRIEPDNFVGCETETSGGREVATELRVRSWLYVKQNGVDVLTDQVERWTKTDVEVWQREIGQQVPDREANVGTAWMVGYRMLSTRPHGFPHGIPVVDVYTKRIGMMHGEPPLEDLAWQNVAHWQSLSMQTEAVHSARHPILKITGVSADAAQSRPTLGPGATLTDTSPDAEVAFVEIGGASLAAGETEIERIEQRCQALGMQPMLAVQGPDTATGEVRADSNEKSEAQKWIDALEWAVHRGMQMAADWLGVALPDEFSWTLARDSSLIAGKAADVPVITQLMRDGQIPLAVGIRELVLRGVLATVEDADELAAEVQEERSRSQESQMAAMVAQIEEERRRASEKSTGDAPDGGGKAAA
jgi:hypothetical protein